LLQLTAPLLDLLAPALPGGIEESTAQAALALVLDLR
jgi:hypothetical protein